MRKLLTILAFAGLTLSACGGLYEKVTFENKSSYTVSFVVLFDLISKTLEPGQTTLIDIEDGFHGFKSLPTIEWPKTAANDQKPSSLRVEYTQKGNTITFTDISPITLEVLSLFDDNVTLRAGDYMETEPMTVKKGKDNHNIIYTKTPTFSAYAASLYPATVTYVYNTARNTMYITIR